MRKTFKRKTLRKKSVRGGRKSSAVSSAVKTYVKRTLHSAIENKCVQINAGSNFGNVFESPDLNAYPMCPLTAFWTIPQGVGQGGRIGNVIKIRKVRLNYILRPTPYDALVNPAPQPSEIQMFLGFVKIPHHLHRFLEMLLNSSNLVLLLPRRLVLFVILSVL